MAQAMDVLTRNTPSSATDRLAATKRPTGMLGNPMLTVKMKRQFDEYVSGLDSSSPDASIQFEEWLDKEGFGIGDNDHVFKKNSKG